MPGRRPEAAADPDPHKLSTDDAPISAQPVDECPGIWLGTVVPKRHAKRAVTRNLLRRQMRAAVLRRQAAGAAAVRAGLWIVRLRTGFDRAAFVSAASPALRHAAREELDALLADAARKLDAGPAAHQVPR